jgi:hypothetical protein
VVRGVRLPGGAVLQSHRSGLSSAGGQNYRSFLGIYEFIRTACGLLGGDTSLTSGYARVQMAPPGATFDQLFAASYGAVERTEYANSLDALDELQDELEATLRGVVIGLRDGTISSDGLDTFKLGYEFVRDQIGLRREHLKRHAIPDHTQDDKVVVVKTAQSA